MTTVRTPLVTLAVALLAWLGASAALGSDASPTTARTAAPATAFLVVQAPAGSARPAPADVAAARAAAPGVPARVVVVTGTADAQSTVARLAAEDPDALLIGRGPAVAGALAAADEAWPALRTVVAR